MATIMCLPDEVIDNILGYSNITIEEIINFRCVCKKFRWAAEYDKFLEKKLSQRWPSAKKVYDKQFKRNNQKESVESEQKYKKSLNFKKTGKNFAIQLRSYVSQIIHRHYEATSPLYARSINNLIKLEDIFHLDENLRNNMDEIIFKPENIFKYSLFIDEIKYLLTQSPRRTGCDLTERYCNIKIMHYLMQRSLKKKWDNYKMKPDRRQLLERAATILAQWVQPEKNVSYSCVKALLNSMALEVLKCLVEKHPDHSIFSTPNETFSYWRNYNIDDNHWNEAEGTQIMDTLQEYMFGKLNFRHYNYGNNINLEYRCIDNVLNSKYGEILILYIIYHSVARRLGLRCDIISNAVGPYCIFWKPKYATHNLENIRCFTLSYEIEKFPDCLVNEVSHFMAMYSERSFLGDFLITANNRMWYEIRRRLEYYMVFRSTFSINSHVYCSERPMLNLRFKKGAMVPRSEDIKFAVGMIVTHCDYPYIHACTGVIIGWYRSMDGKHVEVSTEDDWDDEVTDIGLLPLNHNYIWKFLKQQTNYIILTDKNEMCCVAEDTITLTTPKWIENSEIGRYFCKFEGTHYVPNKMLARLYPQDAAITAAIAVNGSAT